MSFAWRLAAPEVDIQHLLALKGTYNPAVKLAEVAPKASNKILSDVPFMFCPQRYRTRYPLKEEENLHAFDVLPAIHTGIFYIGSAH